MRISTCIILAAATTLALAQPGPPRRPLTDMNAGFLNNPAVQTDLHLSAAQIQKITAALPQRGGGRGGPGGPPGGGRGGPGGPPGGGRGGPGGGDRQKANDAAIAVLSGPQKGRLKEITLQAEGGAALTIPAVQKTLGLNAGQVSKITAEAAKVSAARQAMFQGMGQTRPGQGSDPKALAAAVAKMQAEGERERREFNGVIDKTLTAGQKSKWKSMQGRAFDVSQLRRRPGGGGRGGPGARPGGRGA